MEEKFHFLVRITLSWWEKLSSCSVQSIFHSLSRGFSLLWNWDSAGWAAVGFNLSRIQGIIDSEAWKLQEDWEVSGVPRTTSMRKVLTTQPPRLFVAVTKVSVSLGSRGAAQTARWFSNKATQLWLERDEGKIFRFRCETSRRVCMCTGDSSSPSNDSNSIKLIDVIGSVHTENFPGGDDRLLRGAWKSNNPSLFVRVHRRNSSLCLSFHLIFCGIPFSWNMLHLQSTWRQKPSCVRVCH